MMSEKQDRNWKEMAAILSLLRTDIAALEVENAVLKSVQAADLIPEDMGKVKPVRSWEITVRELKSENTALRSALEDLRELTKMSTASGTELGAPDFVLFKLPKDGGLRVRGIGILERVDKLLKRGEV